MKKETSKKIKAIGMAALAGGLGVVAGAFAFPVTNELTVTNTEYITETVVEEVEVPVEVIVEKEVLVDNGNLDIVLEYMIDGNVDLVTEGLEDEDIDLIVDRIVFINEAESIVKEFIKDNVFEHRAEKNDADEELYSDLFILDVSLGNLNFQDYKDFGYTTAKANVTFAFRYDGGAFLEKTEEVEIWNNKVRFN